MTKDGEVICHNYIANLFSGLEKETGTKVLVVPGNHDMNNPHSFYYDGDNTTPAESANEEQFAAIYANLGYDEAVERRANSLDYMAYPAGGVAFIGVDSNIENTSKKLFVEGGLSEEQAEWIKLMVKKAHDDGRYVLMSMHHNLVDFYDNAQLIRGANIANARDDKFNNQSLITKMCEAGVDVVFSGHSHMHSITSATSNSHTVYSVVTSSLVNLPLAFRTGYIDKNGKMFLFSESLRKCSIPSGVNLENEGTRYWSDLSDYYMREAADKAWGAAGEILESALGFADKAAFLAFLREHFRGVFYTFLMRTSDGNEHLVTPKANVEEAEAALEYLMDFLDEKGAKEVVDFLMREIIFGFGLDELHMQMFNFFHSAYFNYLGNGPVMRDDFAEIQLTK